MCAVPAIPLDNIVANPYVVLASTSIGGHLGWFETSGERWSDRVVRKFFERVCGETEGVERIKGEAVAIEVSPEEKGVQYNPVRRRLFWPVAQS